LKFTPRGHVRLVAYAEANDRIVFQVSDTGIGIAPEDQARIFEEFAQVESEIQTRVKGTGLGLPLARRLAGLLGGTISLTSEPGHGSTFTVTLPIQFDKPKQSEAIQPPSNQLATGGTILFIEDNPETSFVHEVSMRNTNYQLVFAANLPEARAIMRTSVPAAVALDRFLDEKDCLFYIQEMKAQGYSGPIVVISVVDDSQAATDAGADAFLAKPITPSILANTFRELIEGQASRSVLLVDDDEVTRYVLGEALAKLNYRILEAPSGRQAINMAKSHTPTVIFLDILMPDLSGFEVLRELRGNSEISDTPVIIHTSKDLSALERGQLDDLGAVLYPKQPLGGAGTSEQLLHILSVAGVER
jgi:CheY-like chemotaxis protein